MGRKSEISAGLLVHRRTPAIEVLLAHPGGPYWARKDAGAWTIPKGLVGDGESVADLLTTARREFSEETGFAARPPFVPLAPVRQKSGKTVHAFACAGDFDPEKLVSNEFEMEWPPRSGKRARFPEIDRVAWFSLAAARQKILPYQRPLLDELESMLHGSSTPGA